MANTPRDPGKRRGDELHGAAPRRERDGGGANSGRDDRGREVAGAERVGDEQDRDGVGAGRGAAEDETLLEPDAVRCEPDPDGREPGEQPGLGARHGLGRGEEPGTEKGEGKCGDGGGSHAGDGLLEDELRRCVDEEHVRRGDGAVDEGGCLQARIAHPRRRPRTSSSASAAQVRARLVPESMSAVATAASDRADTPSTKREGRLRASEREPRSGPDHGRTGER